MADVDFLARDDARVVTQLPYELIGADIERKKQMVIILIEAIGNLLVMDAETIWLKLAGNSRFEISEILGVHPDTADEYLSRACLKLAKPLAPFIGST